MMNRIRILNTSGVGRRTEIIDADTGEKIQNVTKVEIVIAMNRPVECILHMINVEIDVVAQDSTKEVTTIVSNESEG
jgi:predicted aspartyl protease